MNYGYRLKDVRTYYNISQKEVAKLLNISAYTYSHYETQDSLMPLKHLLTFCNHYHVSLSFIFGFTKKLTFSPNYNSNIDLKLIGSNLKAFRKKYQITQVALANTLHVARSILSEYEHGNFLISTHALYTICSKYHQNPDHLLGRLPQPVNL